MDPLDEADEPVAHLLAVRGSVSATSPVAGGAGCSWGARTSRCRIRSSRIALLSPPPDHLGLQADAWYDACA